MGTITTTTNPHHNSDEEDKDNDGLETQMLLEPRYVFFTFFLLLTKLWVQVQNGNDNNEHQ